MTREPHKLLDRYGIVLALIVALLGAFAVPLDSEWWYAALSALAGITLLVTLAASGARRRTLRIVSGLVVASIVLALAAALGSTTSALAVTGTIAALLVGVAPFIIGRRLLEHEYVSGHTVAGALCIYLLIGLFFAFGLRTLALLTAEPVLAGALTGATVDYVYYSFVTLSTLGYGDITPVTSVARIVSITEALLGQLYLVTVVAMLVTNVHRKRSD